MAAVNHQKPFTEKIFVPGEFVLLPALVATGLVYRVYIIQVVNNGSAREIVLKEGLLVKWRATIPKDGIITATFGAQGWTFDREEPLSAVVTGNNPDIDVNMLSWATVRVSG